MLVLVVIYGHQ